MVSHRELLEAVPSQFILAAGLLVVGIVLAILTGRLNRRLLDRAGVPEAVEATAFERTARSLGTSTVQIVARLSMLFIVVVAVLAAVAVIDINYALQFWTGVTGLLPSLFIAVLVLIGGVVIGDKVELAVSERLRGVKLPQVGLLPKLAKYSVVYVAILIAMGQVGVVTDALLIMLAVYVFGVVFLSGLALQDVLASGAAGMYLILNQSYAIGDEVEIGDHRGIVQEVTVLVTRIESDNEEYILPNRRVFEEGIVRKRRD